MHGESARDLALERFRDYLVLLARMQIGERHRGKIDASDMVQQILLEAHRKREQFRGHSAGEMAAWLRQMLACGLADALRALGRAKRDPARERSLQEAIDASSMRLEALLPADMSSPSGKAERHETVFQLAEALAHLPEGQREAVVLRHCRGWSLDRIAVHMNSTERAVAGLLQRGLGQLRTELQDLP